MHIRPNQYSEEIVPRVTLTGTCVHFDGSTEHIVRNLHSAGKGVISPDGTRFWLNIPKNGSDSTVYQLVYQNQWRDAVYHDQSVKQTVKEVIVTVREPIDRWQKCALEIACIRREQMLYAKLESQFLEWLHRGEHLNPHNYYDGHYFRQVDRLAGIDCDLITYVPMGAQYPQNLEQVLGYGPLPQRRIAAHNPVKQQLWEIMEPLFTEELQQQAQQFYQLDTELYERVLQQSQAQPATQL